MNGSGQLGDNTIVDKHVPTQVSTITSVSAIAGGGSHSLALKSDGTAWAWGSNTNGQLGDTTVVDKHVPTQVSTITGVTAIAGGSTQSVALKSDGTVWDWGFNSNGQLGDNTIVEKHAPVQVSGLAGAVAIASGQSHSAALKSDGTVWDWGINTNGQLGDNTLVEKHVPVQVTGLTGVTGIASGGYHNLAIFDPGTSAAADMGLNSNGQLGDNTIVDKHIPTAVSGLSGVMAIAAGDYHTLALTSDGTVWAWGYNLSGQLGDNTTVDKHVPTQVSGLTGVMSIASGDYFSLALKSDGTVWAWGSNTNGQLGDNTIVQKNVPVQVSTITGVTAIAGGAAHAMALKADGTVWSWGHNATGQLGDNTVVDKHTPVQVSGFTGGVAVAAGSNHSLALKSDGTVWAWGENTSNGQLGDNTVVDKHTPVQVNTITGVTAIAAGGYFGLALKSDGTVWTWGSNSSGQLGDNTVVDKHTPVQATGLTTITAIAGTQDGFGSMALKSDGTAWDWGDNSSGQLGDTTLVDKHTAAQVSGLTGVTAIAAGQNHDAVIRTPAAGAPAITGISPTWGPPAGGTSVVITGSGFTGTTAVAFGVTAATGFTVNSNIQITATSPAAGASTVDIRVTAPGGTSPTSASDQFTYGSLTLAVGTVPGPVRVQHNEAVSAGNVTTLPVSLPSQPALNDLLVVVAGGSVAATDTLVGPAGYTLANTATGSRTGSSGAIWYKVAVGGESATVTVGGTSGSLAVAIQEWPGVAAASPLDPTAANIATAAGTTAATGTTGVTSQASDLVIAGMASGGVTAGNTFSAWSAGYTTGPVDLEAVGTRRTGLGVASQVVSATGAQSATATWTTSGTPVGLIAAFKASGITQIVAFPTMTLNGTNQSLTQTVSFTVADTRGNGAGWAISGTGTQFSDGNGHTLPTTATTVVSQPSWSCGSGCTAPNLPVNCTTLVYTLPTGAATSMCAAAATTGQNTMTGVVTFTLTAPGNQVGIGTYQSTWTFTIA